jgi:serine/threonine protein phosphatase PrpC
MLKCGAAPSYIKICKSVRRVKCKSLAAGLGAPPLDAPDHVTMELQVGSIAVIVSDGAIASGDDEWLVSAISGYEDANPRELAAMIVEAASKKSGCEEDITAIALCLTNRE